MWRITAVLVLLILIVVTGGFAALMFRLTDDKDPPDER